MLTTNHKQIKEWAENYDGEPEIIDDLSAGSDRVGLRINFPGISDDRFLREKTTRKKVKWGTFFKIFDKENLAFEAIDEDISVNPSVTYRFIKRDET